MGSLEGVTSLGPWGGPGGGSWRFIANRGINEIVITHKGSIKSISFKDADGQYSGTFGGNPNNIDETKTIHIGWPSEYLKSIAGSYGKYAGFLVIRSLSFTTNSTTYGPYGITCISDTSFSLPMRGDIIVGFFGRSSSYLDAIGIYVKPRVSVENISFGKWGGTGGDPWSFKASTGINEIVVHKGDNIKSISFKDANGQQFGKYGGGNDNDLGEKKTISIDWPLEHLTSINGSYGTYNGLLVITSLSFVTNRNTHGPFGNSSGNTSFSIPMEGGVIVGFYGRGGNCLDAIGIYVESWCLERSISLGPWGGPGGELGSFITSCGINQITLYEGDNIKSISFRDTNGLQSGKFGGKSPNDIGKKIIIDIDSPSEYLMSITGSHGNYNGLLVITSLSFITNRTIHGPFGKYSSGDTSFSIPMEGGVIVGFHGRGGNFLDAIGIHVKPKQLGGSISFGPWGGLGGKPWTFIASGGINVIVISYGININSITFRGTDCNHSGTFGGNNHNDPGETKTVEIDWPSEYLTSMIGSYGKFNGSLVITSLSFSTNRRTYGPFGTNSRSDTSFSLPMEGDVILGFFGRSSDNYLDAIGIYVKPVSSLKN